MAKRRIIPPEIEAAVAAGVEAVHVEEVPAREVGTHVEEEAVPFEVRPDGSIAHFAHAAAHQQREMGS